MVRRTGCYQRGRPREKHRTIGIVGRGTSLPHNLKWRDGAIRLASRLEGTVCNIFEEKYLPRRQS